MSERTQIQQFFAGKAIFVTGGTGFLGSLLIEKLLRCCPDIARMYVLVREKWGSKSEQRFKDFFKYDIFDEIKATHPDRLNKVTLVKGSLEMPKLGLSPEDWDTIVENVECIFHVGAVVAFTGKLRDIVMPNVFGTREMVHLAKEVKNLKCLLYVSSTFSQCNKPVVEEKVYESDMAAEDVLLLQQKLGPKLDEIESAFVGNFPNTYTYSKFLAEDFVRRNTREIPVGIVRPSMVCQTWKDPVRGWADPQNTVARFLCAFEVGMCHVFPSTPNLIVDLIPADYVINTMIAAAWEVGTSWNSKQEHIEVFNCNSSHYNPITSNQIVEFILKYLEKYPSSFAIWSPFIVLKSSAFYRQLLYYLQLPQILAMDMANYVLGKPRMFLKLYKKANDRVLIYLYFLTNTWLFKSDNTNRLFNKLEENDQKIFNFDLGAIQWSSVFDNYLFGSRKYLLKDAEDSLPKAEKRNQFLKVVHQSTVFSITFIIIMFLCLFFYFIFNILSA